MIHYDLEILKAITAILKADNTEGDNVHSFVGDKIFQGNTAIQGSKTPHVTIDVAFGEDEVTLPAEHGEVVIKVWYPTDISKYSTSCRKCTSRIDHLLNANPAVIAANCNISAMRLFDRTDKYFLPDGENVFLAGTLNYDFTLSNL